MSVGMTTDYAGGRGVVKGASRRAKGIRNHRSQCSPKAIAAAREKRLKRAERARRRY